VPQFFRGRQGAWGIQGPRQSAAQSPGRAFGHPSTTATTRKLSLTEAGEIYYERCRQVLDDLRAIEQTVTGVQEEVRGLLHICSPHLLGEVLLVPAIAKFLQIHPKLEVECDFSSRRVDLIEERYDLALQVGSRNDINVVNCSILPTQFFVVASPDYLASAGTPATPQELKNHKCLLFADHRQSKPWKFKGENNEIAIQIKSDWRSNSGQALRVAAQQGLGLAYLPDYYLKEDLVNGSLVRVLEDWPSVDRSIVAIYQEKRHLSAKIKLFTEFLQQYCKTTV